MSSPDAPVLAERNLVKRNLSVTLLTDQQKKAYEQIQQHRADGRRFINLHGPTGSGKTIVGWVLQATDDWEYLTSIDQKPSSQAMVVDNGDGSRQATRRLRNKAELHKVQHVVYITASPASELHPRVRLGGDDDHRKAIEASLNELKQDDSA
jgi:primosomal protein N'